VKLFVPTACDRKDICLNHRILLLAIGMDWSLYRAGGDARMNRHYREKTRESIRKFRSYRCKVMEAV
jgi:hypothetical protein